jgi:Ca-activated chloride channel family protein
MHQVNKSLILPLMLVFCLVIGLKGQQQQQQAPPSTPIGAEEPSAPPVMMPQTQAPAQTQQPAQQAPQQQAPAPGQTGQAPAQQPANQPGNTVQVPAQQRGQAADSQEGGVFVFRKRVEEVTLHATVVDDRQKLVTNLDKTSFTVYEDGQPQQITSFRREDIPVSLGILIDNSGSMRDKRPAVNQAALNLVRSSNPADQVFIVNFNEDYYLDQDYTSNVNLLRESLEKIESRGGTAMYDALVASADHLMKTAKLDKKALLVVTDGEDNASRESLEAAIRRLAVDGGPTVYTIGILGEEGRRSEKVAKRALAAVAERTGGVSFFPRDLSEVDAISRQVAKDIRNQYSIGYKPTNPQNRGGYRQVKVEAKANGYKRLQVRTRSGYYAGEERAAAGNP